MLSNATTDCPHQEIVDFKAHLYAAIGKFWDEHDLAEFWHKTRKVNVTRINRPTLQRVLKAGK